jgi:hypothetical protein
MRYIIKQRVLSAQGVPRHTKNITKYWEENTTWITGSVNVQASEGLDHHDDLKLE